MNKKYFFVFAGALLSALVLLCMLKPHAVERWEFQDKAGEMVLIERITTGDLHENARVYFTAYSTWLKAYPGVVAQFVPSVYPTIEAFLQASFDEEAKEFLAQKPDQYFVHAVRAGVPVGYMLFEVKDHCAFLRSLAIDPIRQGTGIGRELTRGIFKIRPDVGSAWLMVSRENPVAVGFYRHLGFVENVSLAPTQMDQKTWMAMEFLKN